MKKKLKQLQINLLSAREQAYAMENSLEKTQKINEIDKKIKLEMEEINTHITSIPGIGPISAAAIYSELNGVHCFESPSQIQAFAGIEPSTNDSGEHSYRGHMVKRGSSHLRCAILNCCLPLIQFNMTFAELLVDIGLDLDVDAVKDFTLKLSAAITNQSKTPSQK